MYKRIFEGCLMLIFIYVMEFIFSEYRKVSWRQIGIMHAYWFKKKTNHFI